MALTDGDLVKIGKLITENVGQALEQVVFPKFMEIEEKMATKEDLKKMENRLERKIEDVDKKLDLLAGVTTDMKTNHERWIRKLEEETGIELQTRLVA